MPDLIDIVFTGYYTRDINKRVATDKGLKDKMIFAAQFNNTALQINETEAEIKRLQEKLTNLQEYQQQLASVEQAANSAMEQIRVARSMIAHVDPSLSKAFQDAINAEFESEIVATSGLLSEQESETEEKDDKSFGLEFESLTVVSEDGEIWTEEVEEDEEVEENETDKPTSSAITKLSDNALFTLELLEEFNLKAFWKGKASQKLAKQILIDKCLNYRNKNGDKPTEQERFMRGVFLESTGKDFWIRARKLYQDYKQGQEA